MSNETELTRLRRYFGYTQQDMADLIGVRLRTYINKEKGISQFKLKEMFLISDKFKKPIEEIFLPEDFMPHEIGGEKNARK